VFDDQKLELTYPCNWSYKIIGMSHEALQSAVEELLENREFTTAVSKTSKGGKYCSLGLELLVHSDDDRHSVFEQLKQHQHVKMVL
jgi:putative lipoic acid-binding regulatory protein